MVTVTVMVKNNRSSSHGLAKVALGAPIKLPLRNRLNALLTVTKADPLFVLPAPLDKVGELANLCLSRNLFPAHIT
jgi:hypothetical protein